MTSSLRNCDSRQSWKETAAEPRQRARRFSNSRLLFRSNVTNTRRTKTRLHYTRVLYLLKFQFLQISISPIPLFCLAAKRDAAAPRHRVPSISIHDRSRQRGRHTSRERRDAMRRKTHRCNSHRHSPSLPPFDPPPSLLFPLRARARARARVSLSHLVSPSRSVEYWNFEKPGCSGRQP